MKKIFDLKAALAGDKVITRGENEVKQLHCFLVDGEERLVGVLGNNIRNWPITGVSDVSLMLDLYMATKKEKRWLAVSSNRKLPIYQFYNLDLANDFLANNSANFWQIIEFEVDV